MTAAGKTYFRYHLRSKWKMLLCITVITLAFALVFAATIRKEYTFYGINRLEIHNVVYACPLEPSIVALGWCCIILPVTEFSVFKKRRNLDCFYGLPISRRKMGVIHYITGAICLIVPYTCTFLLSFLFMLRYPEGFDYSPLLSFYFLALGLGLSAYSINVFAFNRANTVFDGICFMALCNFLIQAIVGTWNELSWAVYDARFSEIDYLDTIRVAWQEKWEIPYYEASSPLDALTELDWIYSKAIEKVENASIMERFGDWRYVGWFVFWPMIGIASTVGFVFSFGKGRAEKTEEISDSWFGYKLMIPLYALLFTVTNFGIGIIGVLVTVFVAYIIYRRGFRLKLSDWLVMAGLFVLNIVLCIIDNFVYI